MSQLAKILVLSFVGSIPETAAELHRQLREEVESAATFEQVEQHLTELANDNFIAAAAKNDGTPIYWR